MSKQTLVAYNESGATLMRMDLERDEKGAVNCKVFDKDVFIDETCENVLLVPISELQSNILNYLQETFK